MVLSGPDKNLRSPQGLSKTSLCHALRGRLPLGPSGDIRSNRPDNTATTDVSAGIITSSARRALGWTVLVRRSTAWHACIFLYAVRLRQGTLDRPSPSREGYLARYFEYFNTEQIEKLDYVYKGAIGGAMTVGRAKFKDSVSRRFAGCRWNHYAGWLTWLVALESTDWSSMVAS